MYHLILVLSEANLSDGLLLAPYRVLVNDEDQQSSHHPMHNAKNASPSCAAWSPF